jgi:hypothetical protein
MNKDIQKICDALDLLAEVVIESYPHKDQLFSEQWSWQVPTMNRQDLSWMVRSISNDLKIADPEDYLEELKPWIAHIPSRIAFLQATTLPVAYAGNLPAFSAFIDSLKYIRERLLPAVGWTPVPVKTAMPAPLIRRISAAKSRLEDLEKEIPNLAEKVSAINSAHLVAENLEVDLHALAEAREAVEEAAEETTLNSEKAVLSAKESATVLETIQKDAETTWESIERKSDAALREAEEKAKSAIEKMSKHEETAQKLIAQCEAAYHITTTKGLAGAFDQRAASLAWSMRGWVVGLAVALIAGSWIGGARLSTLAAVLTETIPNWPVIVSNVVLSILGVCAPLWFAWLATKQIGQRFRLSEDYAFKSSVAKAYEGYRKEAAVLDPEFQAILFRSALTRLDEAPLRLVESEHHGSPWAEMLNSKAVKEAVKIAPDLPARIMGIVNETLQQAKIVTAGTTSSLQAAKNIILPETAKVKSDTKD